MPSSAKLIHVQKIWDKASHNAFGDLARFQSRWYVTFREGETHHLGEGAIRIIVSDNGEQWSSAALITPKPEHDLRDPHLEVTPDGRLMLIGIDVIRSDHTRPEFVFQTVVWFSSDGRRWDAGTPVGESNVWIWRLTWHENVAFGVGYSTLVDDQFARLYETRDGIHFETRVDRVFDAGYPNESAIVFNDEGTAFCLLRRDGKPQETAQLGIARPPYLDWTWKDLGLRLGGPDMIRLPDGRLVAAARLYNVKAKYDMQFPWRTSLLWVDPEQGTMTEFLELPSGADNSYPGMVYHDDLLWVAYYSGHEDTCDLYHLERQINIYLAKVRLPVLGG